MFDAAFFILALSSLFAIVNPFSTASMFFIITKTNTHREKRAMIKKACMVSLCVMIFFLLAGNFVFSLFHITVQSLKIAGGAFVCFMGFRMLNPETLQKGTTPEHMKEHIKKDDVSIVPMAIPFISGPGAIATILVLTSQNPGMYSLLTILAAIIVVIITTFVGLINAEYLSNYLGKSGIKVIEKLMGLITLTVGVEFILGGITLFVRTLAV